MWLRILGVFAILGILQAAMTTTHKPREPNEFEQLLFFYNKITHNLLLKESDKMEVNCYVKTLTDQQKMQVHRDFGLKQLELNMLTHTSTATMVKMGALADEDRNWCTHGVGNRTVTYFTL